MVVGIAGRFALVRVSGRGSFGVSASLKEFVVSAMEQGAETAVVDLGGCTGMDSTFMGTLAGAAGRLRSRTGGKLVLVNLSAKTRELISTLGLDHVVTAFDAGQVPEEYGKFFTGSPLAVLETGARGDPRTAQVVLEAHETLADMSEANRAQFKDVLEFLRRDVKGAQGPAGRVS